MPPKKTQKEPTEPTRKSSRLNKEDGEVKIEPDQEEEVSTEQAGARSDIAIPSIEKESAQENELTAPTTLTSNSPPISTMTTNAELSAQLNALLQRIT